MFKEQNFCHIASNNRNNVKVGVFVYRTSDDINTVTVSGYFNERIIDINLHDIIIHEKIDPVDSTVVQRNTLCVVKRTVDNVETKEIHSAWEELTDQAIQNIQNALANITLNDLTDVNINNVQVGDYLRWNGAEWINMAGGGGGSAVWGSIGGDIEDQADLQSALSDKADVTALAGKADIDLGNIDSDGEDVIKALAPDGDYDNTVSGLSATTLQTAIDELATTNPLLNLLYPVGAVYIGTQSTCPLATLIPGSTWQLVATDRALWGGNGSNANTTIAAGLPDGRGAFTESGANVTSVAGGMHKASSYSAGWGSTGGDNTATVEYRNSWWNSIFGQSTTVQPPAYRVNVWRRTA